MEARFASVADFERKIISEQVKLFLLCSPHNPVCRVWTEEELRRLRDICRAHGIYVVSDEIHCNFAFPEHPHHTFLTAVPEAEQFQRVVPACPRQTLEQALTQLERAVNG
ncbi:MAG: aminotransferase class I/II-fold pyridoxal phosphate-dependent enzyme [Lawsonibacter sp.]|nr:aminotransferase class I/II-fold pyridoxal phosphate-dependent enzyme [Lawsonibacter sp.]